MYRAVWWYNLHSFAEMGSNFTHSGMLHCCAVLLVQVYAGGQMSGARLKAVDELEDVFSTAGVDVQAPVVLR
jgi:hypothetical protein